MVAVIIIENNSCLAGLHTALRVAHQLLRVSPSQAHPPWPPGLKAHCALTALCWGPVPVCLPLPATRWQDKPSMRKGCYNLVPGGLLQGLRLGTRLQETVLWCTLQNPSVPVSLSQSPFMVISTSMCLATSLSLAPWEEGPFLHNLGLRKGKEEPGYYPKAPTLAPPMGDGSPRAKGEASKEGRPRPWPRSTECSSPSPLRAVQTRAWAPCSWHL